MQTSRIPLGTENFMQEFIIDDSEPVPVTVSHPTGEGQPIEIFRKVYINDDLVEGRFPLIQGGKFKKLEEILARFSREGYKVPERFALFAARILEERRGSATNGSIISVYDMGTNDDATPRLGCRPARYFDLIKTNLAQDIDISQYAIDFCHGTTWRSIEADNGKAIPLSSSGMVNQLGITYLVLTENEQHMITAMRRSDLAVEGGTIGLIGSSPQFPSGILNGTQSFEDFLKRHVEDSEGKLAQELCLQAGEYHFKEGFVMRDLMRGANIFMVYVLKGTTPKTLAERCTLRTEPKKQHMRIYEVPLNMDAISMLEQGASGYSMNLASFGICYHVLKGR